MSIRTFGRGSKRILENKIAEPEPLIFPQGVRFPTNEEIPADSRDVLDRVANAKITTGYTLQNVDGRQFDAYFEANVHAPNVFEVFRQLSFSLMPEVAAPLIGIKEDEPVFGPYTDRALAIAVFEPYIHHLQNDGFLEFGVIHQSQSVFEEIFVASPKYFKIWTNNAKAAEAVLESAGIPKCEKLEFIDEYPMVSLSVAEDGNAAWLGPFYSIQEEFRKLPNFENDEL